MDGYGKRVLIVEDDCLARDMLAAIFLQAGYNVHAARDGQEALAELKRRHFDAIVTDCHMPRLNGMELLSVTRIVWPETPVVLVSGDQLDLSDTAARQGAYAWVQKPCDPSFLLELVGGAVRTSAREASRHMSFPTAG